MIGILISTLVFLAVFLGIFAINLVFTDLFKKDKQDRLDQLEAELRQQLRNQLQKDNEPGNANLSELAAVSEATEHMTVGTIWKKLVSITRQSGMNISASQLAFATLIISISVMLVTLLLSGSPVWSGISAGISAFLPFGFVKLKRKQRLNEILNALPDALELMSRILRSGQTVNQGMLVIAEEFRGPISREFAWCYEQQNLGIGADVALRQLALRTGLMEIRIFVLGVLIQAQTGGNLAVLLDKLSTIIRKRAQLNEQIKGLTAEGRLQATILLALPFVMWFALFIVNRGYALKLLDHPNLVWMTIGSMFIGAVWIRKIVNFEY